MAKEPTVAVLGAGALGAAMATRLGATGHEVRLWNRTVERAQLAAKEAVGVRAVASVADAVRGAAVVFTVLRDGDAVASVMDLALGEMDSGAVWVQASTVGPDQARRLGELAKERGVAYLDAPVSGSTAPALQGKLVWLVAGDKGVLETARGVLDALGQTILHVGASVEGSALKLAVNAWMAAATVAMSDVLALCDDLGVPHDAFVSALEAGPLAMPYALAKLRLMDERAYAPGFAVGLALKDVLLAAETSSPSPLLRVVVERLEYTAEAGHAEDDLAAVDFERTGVRG
jgi:3-hydroxyisobutyrate dehydrogenase